MHSFTLLLVYNVQWPVGNCQASIAYPHVLLKPNLSSITNYPPDAHVGGLHSPKHPSPEKGCTDIWAAKHIRVTSFIFEVHNVPPNSTIIQLVSENPGP
jgi:hypothetical protein